MSTDVLGTIIVVSFLVFLATIAYIDYKRYAIRRHEHVRPASAVEAMRQHMARHAPDWTYAVTTTEEEKDRT